MMRGAVASCVVVLALAGLARADELHRQDPINSFSGLSSQDARNPGGLGMMYETAVDIQAQAGWTITGIEFWGGYPRVQPGNTHGFMIRFYDSADGAVGPLLSTQDVASFTETVFYTHPSLGWPGYHYTLTLNTPFAVPAAGQYWMSVTAILDFGGGADSVQWGWVAAQSVEGSGCMQSSFNGPFQPQLGQDVSYVLNGTVGGSSHCGTADFNCDGDVGTDSDIAGFFACLAGSCPAAPCTNSADFNGDGDVGTDGDIEAFFRVLGGGTC